ncbi:NUDIX hydrolase [Halalkalibacterium ligniniphilum]|uniref:NUDIX hydrolase n=1 Tax=Halalkalibacterium ligniniphilum TaxID=1134413 RepID=UPI00034BF4E2|nr:CoA pyrophosphatase [Halalkalibacterium ligniniphilum]
MKPFEDIKQRLESHTPNVLGQSQARHSAVLLPLIEKNGEPHLLFEVRSKNLKRQPGEICFPGGRIDPTDKTPQAASIREAVEELGVSYDDIQPIGQLDLLVTPFRGIIYPFVAELNPNAKLNPNTYEVHEVFTVPLSYLQQYQPELHHMTIQFKPSAGFPLDAIANRSAYKERKHTIPEFFYFYQDYVIWGLTARILRHFLELIGTSAPSESHVLKKES